eukprot:ctg_1892.g716
MRLAARATPFGSGGVGGQGEGRAGAEPRLTENGGAAWRPERQSRVECIWIEGGYRAQTEKHSTPLCSLSYLFMQPSMPRKRIQLAVELERFLASSTFQRIWQWLEAMNAGGGGAGVCAVGTAGGVGGRGAAAVGGAEPVRQPGVPYLVRQDVQRGAGDGGVSGGLVRRPHPHRLRHRPRGLLPAIYVWLARAGIRGGRAGQAPAGFAGVAAVSAGDPQTTVDVPAGAGRFARRLGTGRLLFPAVSVATPGARVPLPGRDSLHLADETRSLQRALPDAVRYQRVGELAQGEHGHVAHVQGGSVVQTAGHSAHPLREAGAVSGRRRRGVGSEGTMRRPESTSGWRYSDATANGERGHYCTSAHLTRPIPIGRAARSMSSTTRDTRDTRRRNGECLRPATPSVGNPAAVATCPDWRTCAAHRRVACPPALCGRSRPVRVPARARAHAVAPCGDCRC